MKIGTKMTVDEKLDNGYYNQKDNEYYEEWKSGNKKGTRKAAYNEFKQDTLEELELTNHPKANRFFEICWDQGHASSYREVWNYMEEWSDLLK